MLRAFLDRGEKRGDNGSVMCVAGVIFKPTAYKQFVRPWERMLRRWDASAFHATDFYPGGGEFNRKGNPEREAWFEEDSRAIPKTVGEHASLVVTVAFRPDEFIAKASSEWKEAFGTDTHAMAVQLCLVINGWWLQEKRSTEYFGYIQESGDEKEGQVQEVVRTLRNAPDYSKLIRVKSFTSAEKGFARGLEAADFLAWHWNKHVIDRLDKGIGPRKDFAAFANLTEHRGKVKAMFITGEHLDTYIKTMEKAWRDKRDQKEGMNT
jgi:hypothetical protein